MAPLALVGSFGCAVIEVFGAAVSIVHVRDAGVGVGVARGVGGADLEGVGAVAEAGVALRARAGAPAAASRLHSKRRAALVGAEREARAGRVGRIARLGGDRRVGRRGVDRPAEARRRRVGVACGVGRAHVEGVRAVGEAACSSSDSCMALQAPPSRRHSNVEPPSLELKPKSASVELAGSLGCDVIVVFGGPVSSDHVKLAGVGSVLPAGSVARTSKACDPSARPVYAFGLVQALQAPPSMRHSKVELPSLELNEKLASADPDGSLGCAVIVVFGAAVSTVQREARRRRVDVPGWVGRADVEGVCAVARGRCSSSGDRAGGPAAAVDAALEASSRARSTRRRSSASRRARRIARRGVDRRVRGGGVVGERVARAATRRCRPCRSRGRRTT